MVLLVPVDGTAIDRAGGRFVLFFDQVCRSSSSSSQQPATEHSSQTSLVCCAVRCSFVIAFHKICCLLGYLPIERVRVCVFVCANGWVGSERYCRITPSDSILLFFPLSFLCCCYCCCYCCCCCCCCCNCHNFDSLQLHNTLSDL